MSPGTRKALNIEGHHRARTITPLVRYWVPGLPWIYSSFPLKHDATDPIGFLIAYLENRLLFIPDTAFVENRFEGITILVIECNNAEDILSEKILSGAIPAIVGRRIRRNHMSLRNVKEFILANNMSRTLREIWLIHLSDTNSSEERFKKEIQEITGVPTYVA